MAYNAEIADRVLKMMVGREGLTERKMFGGIAFMLNGNMCFGVTNDDLMVRVGADGLEDALDPPHARPMDFTGRPMKGCLRGRRRRGGQGASAMDTAGRDFCRIASG